VIFGLLKCYADKDIGYAKVLYNYNFVFTLLSALFLFGFFKNMKIKSKAAERVIAFLAPATLGVYLLHLNDYSVKWFFRGILRPQDIGNPGLLILHSLFIILAVYLICAMVEKIRLWIFETNPLMKKAFAGIDKLIKFDGHLLDKQ
jgi:surface polysaccharide O-acyltransferase-like enzyme